MYLFSHIPRAVRHIEPAITASAVLRLLAAILLGTLVIALAYQIPVSHHVDIGHYDAAYVQGFYDPERANAPGEHPYLAGSDGTARWTRAASYLIFPQVGLPAQISIHLRGPQAQPQGHEVVVLLNGVQELGRFRAEQRWREYSFTITQGLGKPNDVVIEIRSPVAPLSQEDPRAVGVLLDRAFYTTESWPLLPYPSQMLYGALVSGMLSLLFRGRRFAAALLLVGLLFYLCYRAQPLYPYPLRNMLPLLGGCLAAILIVQGGQQLAHRIPFLHDGLAIGGMLVWGAAVLLVIPQHVTLSIPGVENDFRVFATRLDTLADIFRADGFYNLGYPLLLWLMRPLREGNAFLAAQAVGLISGLLLLVSTWWLARQLLGRGPALLALMILALSPLVVEYALYVGSDMPFAALCTLTLALLLTSSVVTDHPTSVNRSSALLFLWLAGFTGGMAFLVRHPGLILLPLGWAAIIWSRHSTQGRKGQVPGASAPHHQDSQPSNLGARRTPWFAPLAFTLGFLLAILPQLAVNLRDTGNLFYHQQAKNIWLAVYGDGDWQRWGEEANDISIGAIVLRDPARFLRSWWTNVRSFLGTGAEDTSEFGRAIQLRMLGFPANWLALAGLLLWIRDLIWSAGRVSARSILLVWITLYVLAITVGLTLPRFFLPLVPIYALAAAWMSSRIAGWASYPAMAPIPSVITRAPLTILGLLLLVLLGGGFATGSRYVLANQPPDEVAAIELVRTTLQPDERLIVRVPADIPLGKYSAIAHQTVPPPVQADAAVLRATGARYLLWSTQLGEAPSVGPVIDRAGRYILYRIDAQP